MQGKVLDQFRDGRDRFADLHTVRRMKALGVVRSIESGRQEHFTRIFATAQAHVTQYMWDYCCDLADVIGLGASSWSNYGRTFLLNIADIDAWAARVEEGRVPVDRGLHRDLETDARRSLISPLKNDRVRKERFQARLGFDAGEHFGPEIARLRDLDLLSEDDTSIRLTPRGRFIADETVMQFFQRPFLPYPELAHALTPG
jgi:oxygen-independent coproporphyrinogen-3 oxidase